MTNKVKLAIPKGNLYENVIKLLADAGLETTKHGRCYRPYISDPQLEVKILKPQNIPRLVELGSHDLGFTGYDWIAEQGSDVEELLDTGLDPVSIVAAIPKSYNKGELKKRKIIVASEYEKLTRNFLEKEGYNFIFIRTFGATEVFPPEDADMIVENSSTGLTLQENNLKIISTLFKSSTRLIANKNSLQEEGKAKKIKDIVMLLRSILEARKRVFLEMNIPQDKLEEIVPHLPCMKSPTISKLYSGGYAVKVAVKKEELPQLIPLLKKKGATDILEFELKKIVA